MTKEISKSKYLVISSGNSCNANFDQSAVSGASELNCTKYVDHGFLVKVAGSECVPAIFTKRMHVVIGIPADTASYETRCSRAVKLHFTRSSTNS